MENFVDTICKINDKWFWRKDDYNYRTFIGLSKETQLLDIIKPYLKDNKVIVQAGGNCGMQVEKFAQFFETVYTFEPDPINFHCLVNNLPYTNVIKFQCCLGDQNKLVSMTTLPNETGGFYVNQNSGTIPTIKLDDLALERCDFIQLDVEGYQLFVLKGAINTIKKFKPVICIEHEWAHRYEVTVNDIISFLTSLGYYRVEKYTSDYIYVHQALSSSI